MSFSVNTKSPKWLDKSVFFFFFFFPPPQEFEVIAQIKLLQLASNNYSFTQDAHFREWFASTEKLSEAER